MTGEFIEFLKNEGIEEAEEVMSKIVKAKGKPFDVSFDFNIIDSSKRIIKGIASVESVDREKEIITKSALENALEGFKQLPILHLQHSERPAGMITKSSVTDNGLEVECKIPEHKQWDDIWSKIEKGELGKYSIHGRRIDYSSECKIPATQRTNPCVTKGLYLDSISIVRSDTAVNQNSFVEIVKAMDEELTTKTLNTTEEDDNKMTNEEPEVIVKAQLDESISEVQKAFDTKLAEFKDEYDTMNKAYSDLKSELDKLKEEYENVTKARDEKITELSEKVEKMGEEVIKKGEKAVVIHEQVKSPGLFRTSNEGI